VELLKETLHPNLGVSQVLFQRWCILVKRGKDHAHVGLRTQFLQREVLLIYDTTVASWVRETTQTTSQSVRPVVIRTGKPICLALGLITNGRTTVTATVKSGVEISLAVPVDDHRLVSHLSGLEGTGLWDFTFVRYPHPGFIEDLFHLFLEDLRVGIKLTGNTVFCH